MCYQLYIVGRARGKNADIVNREGPGSYKRGSVFMRVLKIDIYVANELSRVNRPLQHYLRRFHVRFPNHKHFD